MSGGFFLWGGFILSILGHLVGWGVMLNTTQTTDSILGVILLLIGGVSLCAFGYLLFS